MSRISLLSEQIYNKIAAGEVVERPVSVLKELVENSLDAGASKIVIRIGGAGTDLIAVSDDGSGMDQDDALLCFEPHATSKIKTEKDLNAITSLGFRGEALPSIASVSKVTLRTRQREKSEGTEVVIDGGKMLDCRPSGCAPGTEITVRDLFFNTPARRKFLKSRNTEEKHIAEMLSNIALAHVSVTFELYFDGRLYFSSPASDEISARIRELFGREYADQMIPLSFTERGITVTGLIAKRTFTKPSRAEQRVFVNARPVESPAVYRGIREGFGPMLDKGRHPPCVLYISLPPDRVDVNVHPAKREVRFASDYEVTGVVRNAVGTALRTAECAVMGFRTEDFLAESPDLAATSSSPSLLTEEEQTNICNGKERKKGEPLPPMIHDPETEEEIRHVMKEMQERKKNPLRDLPPPEWEKPSLSHGETGVVELTGDQQVDELLHSAEVHYTPSAARGNLMQASELPGFPQMEKPQDPEDLHLQQERKEDLPEHTPQPLGLRIIGIFADSYILAEREDGLVVIDQHAAHERILFERLLKGAGEVSSQKLLLPITLELSRSDTVFLSKNAKVIAELGYEAEPFGMNTVKINAIPSAMSQEDAGGTFREMLALAADESMTQMRRTDLDRFAMAACKAAIKAHDKITEEEVSALIRQLAQCEQPFACPHGRPTILNISLKELERRFGRR